MRLNETELGDCFGVNVVEATLKGHGAPEIVLRIAKRKFKSKSSELTMSSHGHR